MDSSEVPMFQLISSLSTQCAGKNSDIDSHSRQQNSMVLDNFISNSNNISDSLGFCWIHDDSSDDSNGTRISLSDQENSKDHDPDDANNGSSNSSITTQSVITDYYTDDSCLDYDKKSFGTQESDFFDSLSQIAHKFDVLFPFYRLSDKDCKEISLFVYENLNSINKVFCVSKGRYLEAYVYYYYYDIKNGSMFDKFVFVNNDDNDEEVSSWNDIIMDEQYCLRELGLFSGVSI